MQLNELEYAINESIHIRLVNKQRRYAFICQILISMIGTYLFKIHIHW